MPIPGRQFQEGFEPEFLVDATVEPHGETVKFGGKRIRERKVGDLIGPDVRERAMKTLFETAGREEALLAQRTRDTDRHDDL